MIKEIFLTITFTILFLSISNILPIIYAEDPNSTMAGTNVTMAGTNVTMAGTNVTMAGTNVTMAGTNVTMAGINVTMAGANVTINYYDTDLSLQITNGSSQGYIKVLPTLTYGSGSKLVTSDVSIYVDGKYITNLSSNQWSSNIFAGSGSHTIKASVLELTDASDSSIKYRSSSVTETHFVSGGTSDQGFPIEYVIVVAAIPAIAVVIAIYKLKSKPKKIARAFCGICGAKFVSKSKFCRKCGNILQK